jgi:hypothetical protein
VRLEGLGQLTKTNDLIENGSNDIPACSIVPQSVTLPRDPHRHMITDDKMLLLLNR